MAGDIQVRQIAFDELDAVQMRHVLALARNQAVDDANAFTAPEEFFSEV